MVQLPAEGNTPFSLPIDTPEVMPVDYPDLDSNIDAQEAYDEGLDDVVDTEPYRQDDDPIKSARRLLQSGGASNEYHTTNHDVIKRWIEYRYGHPAHIIGAHDSLDRGGLYITFEDDEPDIEVEHISWKAFFRIFERNNLAMLYRTKTQSGVQSKFYTFMDRVDVRRTTKARLII